MPNNKNPRQQLGGGAKNQTDIRGARRDAERMMIVEGAQATKKMLRNTYNFSQERAQQMVNNIKGKQGK